MITTFHFIDKSGSWKTHSNSGHLRSCETSIKHEIAPTVHFLLPIRYIIWNYLRKTRVFGQLSIFSHPPKKSPLRIKFWRAFRKWLVILINMGKLTAMITRLLSKLGSDSPLLYNYNKGDTINQISYLVMYLLPLIWQLLVIIKAFSLSHKILLHHINKCIIK